MARFEILDDQGRPFEVAKLPGRRVLAGEPTSTALLHIRERRSRQEWWAQVRAALLWAPTVSRSLAINIWHDVTEERRQDRQTKYLADASAALGSSLDYDEMLATLARVLVPGLGDWC